MSPSIQKIDSIASSLLPSIQLHFRDPHFDFKQTFIIATGKAAALMYHQFCKQYTQYVASQALVIIPDGYPCTQKTSENVELFITDHPFITSRSLAAGERLITRIAANSITSIIALVSGGGSASTEVLKNNDDIYYLNSLITSDNSIVEINAIRAQYSQIKGGKLAMMFPEKKFSVAVISDIPMKNGYAHVGSMPFWSPKHKNADIYEVASSSLLIAAIKQYLRNSGYTIHFSTPFFMHNHETLVTLVKKQMTLLQPGQAAIIGGESTLEVVGKSGNGGRMSHLILSLLNDISDDISIEAFATDGIDGNSSAAGGIIPFNWHKSISSDQIKEKLITFDSATLLQKINLAIKIEATGTNINDVVIILREKKC